MISAENKHNESGAVRLVGISEPAGAEGEAGQERLATEYKKILEDLMSENSRIYRSFSKMERDNLPEDKISPIQSAIVAKTRELMGKYPVADYRMFHILVSSGRFEKLDHFDFPGDDSVIAFLDRLKGQYLAAGTEAAETQVA